MAVHVFTDRSVQVADSLDGRVRFVPRPVGNMEKDVAKMPVDQVNESVGVSHLGLVRCVGLTRVHLKCVTR